MGKRTCISMLLLSLPLLVSAGDLYKWRDKDGKLHYSDRPPQDGSEFEYLDIPTEPRSMVSMRQTGPRHEPSYRFFNHYHGPAELEVRLQIADNVVSSPPLPTTVVIPGHSEMEVVTLGADDPHEGFRYQLAYTMIPGRPIDQLPAETNFYPPFATGSSYPISQGFDDDATHKDAPNRYAVDIVMPTGTPVLAARAGIVMELEDDYHGGEQNRRFLDRANRVRLLHDDGSMTVYAHLQPNSARVYPGARVPAGAWIANSGNTGYSSGPHLHFVVQANVGLALESLPFRFRTPGGGTMTPEGTGMIHGVLAEP